MDLIERIFQREGSLECNDRHAFSPLMRLEIIIYGLVRKCIKLSTFSETIFMLDLNLNYIDKLQEFL